MVPGGRGNRGRAVNKSVICAFSQKGSTKAYPAEGPVVEVEEGVLLLKTEPRLLSGVLLHQLGGLVSVVELVRCAIGHPALCKDENVVAALGAEGVGVDSHGLQVNVAVVARSLAG